MVNNPTYGEKLGQGRTAEIFDISDGKVLKLFNREWSREHVECEARLTEQIFNLGVCETQVFDIVEKDGRYGIVMNRVNGPSMIKQFTKKPWQIWKMAELFASLHARMHKLEVDNLISQKEDMLKMIEKAELSDDIKNAAKARLSVLPDDNKLCHGDYHPYQVLLSPNGPAVIDWISARKGRPAADVAITSILLESAPLPKGATGRAMAAAGRKYAKRLYLRNYMANAKIDEAEVAQWKLPLLVARYSVGIPREKEQLTRMISELV